MTWKRVWSLRLDRGHTRRPEDPSGGKCTSAVCVCKRTEGETSQVFGVMSLNVRLRYMDYCSQIFGFRYTSNIDRRRDPALICQRSYRWTIFFFNPSGIDIFLNTKLFINLLSSAANLFCCFGFILIYLCPFNK